MVSLEPGVVRLATEQRSPCGQAMRDPTVGRLACVSHACTHGLRRHVLCAQQRRDLESALRPRLLEAYHPRVVVLGSSGCKLNSHGWETQPLF